MCGIDVDSLMEKDMDTKTAEATFPEATKGGESAAVKKNVARETRRVPAAAKRTP